jgi:hypothetical protein
MKIRLVWAEKLHAHGETEGQTFMMELIVAFSSFANAPTKPLFTDVSSEHSAFMFVVKQSKEG